MTSTDTSTMQRTETAWQPLRWWEWLLLIICLGLFIAQAFLSSPQKSAAFDEEYHLTAGYAYLKTRDFRLSRTLGHPPLINLLSAGPLLSVQDIELPLEHQAWENGDFQWFSDSFLWQVNDDPQQLLILARLPIIILGALTALVLFVWARQLAGIAASWLALLLAVFDPNLLANSRLVTTDLGLAFFVLLVMWRYWAWLKRPSNQNLVLVGFLAGLAMATKYTGLLIWPVMLTVLLIFPGFRTRFLLKFVLMGLIAYGVVWAIYLFDVGVVEGLDFPLPVLAPAYPAAVLRTYTYINQQPVPAFLLGEVSPDGWWYYFPATLLFKTPLPLLVLAGSGLLVALYSRGVRQMSVLWLPPLAYLLLAMAGPFNIGYRHVLQVVPFMILMASFTVLLPAIFVKRWNLEETDNGKTTGKTKTPVLGYLSQHRRALILTSAFLALLLIWQAVTTVRLYPHYESYFNELVGGPKGGSEVLVDSNLDWGQDLPALRQLMADMGIEEVFLSYFGTAPPESYGVKYKPIPGFIRFTSGAEVDAFNPYNPNPGWYAIAATSLRLGLVRQNPDIYEYFRDKEPVARVGHSINLYKVSYPDSMPVERTFITGQPVSDIPADQLGIRPEHRLIVKWSQSPQTSIVSPEAWREPEGFINLEGNFDDSFSLIGYQIDQTEFVPGDVIDLILYWQKETRDVETPSPVKGPPLAAFVHLYSEGSDQIMAQFDGWGAALSGLETGDIIIQEVSIILPDETMSGSYSLRSGLYSPQSSNRLPVTKDGQLADYVMLTDISVLNSVEK